MGHELETLKKDFVGFLASYDANSKDEIWSQHSRAFRQFWIEKVMEGGKQDLNDYEVDQIIRILDRNGKGNTKNTEAVAVARIPQGAWRRMFNQIKNDKELASTLTHIFNNEEDLKKQAEHIDHLYKLNEERKNNLTGSNGHAVCAMLAAWNPFKYLSVISLKDRKRLINFFKINFKGDFTNESTGKKITESNKAILDGFVLLGTPYNARTLSVFFYLPHIQKIWKQDDVVAHEPLLQTENIYPNTLQNEETAKDPYLFYMESQLEDFLIKNWEKTELGKKYELLEEDGEFVSQQYRTSIGIIDILAKDKQTEQYVIIELKRDQTSDDTVGQLARYMGWIEENKSNGKASKGIIIAARWDERLHYALKKLKDTEIYLYKVDFKLDEFKKA